MVDRDRIIAEALDREIVRITDMEKGNFTLDSLETDLSLMKANLISLRDAVKKPKNI